MKIILQLSLIAALLASIKCKTANSTIQAEVFRADFSKSSLSAAFGGAPVKYGGHNVLLWPSGGGIDVIYPKDSYCPAGPIVGGFGILTQHPLPQTAVFKYSVYFPAGFDFWHGGKLPGLYGGKPSCTAGDPAVVCWNSRIMWREDGDGELHFYANREAQDPALCQDPNNVCDPDFGWSLNKGHFAFRSGEWTDVEQRITLNTPGIRNGILTIKINEVEKVRYITISSSGLLSTPTLLLMAWLSTLSLEAAVPIGALPSAKLLNLKILSCTMMSN